MPVVSVAVVVGAASTLAAAVVASLDVYVASFVGSVPDLNWAFAVDVSLVAVDVASAYSAASPRSAVRALMLVVEEFDVTPYVAVVHETVVVAGAIAVGLDLALLNGMVVVHFEWN